ncbi:MAG TPA: phosphoserine phosphatase [Firmicutes bacterium]|nr:phosphoserine phosphatase [Bacillota bacterium]
MKKPILAILYDFDSTLAISDMQNFSFIPSLGLTPEEFWKKTTGFSAKTGMERTLAYLYVMIKACEEKGIKMTSDYLKEMGKNIKFFPGVLDWFKRVNEYGNEHDVKVEHYLVSSGNREIVTGCPIYKEFKMVYGCEFYFDPVTKLPLWPKLVINFTQKTQYLYRISKGVYDATDDIGVNEKRPERRVPYNNIVYIGDGMTDIPAMIVAKNSGGKSIAVYPKGNRDKVKGLYEDGRVNYIACADYREGTEIEKIMRLIIQGVAINESLSSRENKSL